MLWYDYLYFGCFILTSIQAGFYWGKSEGMWKMLISFIFGHSSYYNVHVYVFEPFGLEKKWSVLFLYITFFFLITIGALIKRVVKKKTKKLRFKINLSKIIKAV